MKKGLYLSIYFLFLMSLDLIANESSFYKYKYLRIGNGLCAKCSFTLKKIAIIEDKYKPLIVMSQSENLYIKDILQFNDLVKYPREKIIINDSLAKRLDVYDFPTLYYSNNIDTFDKIILNQSANLASIKLILGHYKITKQIFDSSFFLPPFTEYYFDSSSILFCNDYSKTVTFINSKKNKIVVKLTNSLKIKIFQKLTTDTQSYNQLLSEAMNATKFGVDNSFFGSVFNYHDTLLLMTYISVVKKVKSQLRSTQIQAIVKLYDNKIISANYIKFNPKKQIIYDEGGEHSMIFKNDSLYLIASHYNIFNKLKKGKHLTLFKIIEGQYFPIKNYNLQIPYDLLKSSNDTLDRTSGQFFNSNKLDYFYINSPSIFFNGKNYNFKCVHFTNPINYRYNAKNICFAEKNGIFTSLIIKVNSDETYLRIGKLNDELILPINLEKFNYNAKIIDNKLVYITNDGFYIEKEIIPAS